MKKLFSSYKASFNGLSKEVWILAFITLINRSGTMVIPFLSIYLKKSLHFSLADVGWIMTIFGIGSLTGSWLGGKLTDKIGYHKTMFLSLVFTGIAFVFLQYANTFWQFSIAIYALMSIADAFRPASYVALNAYSTVENKTRSITLIRLAINLGFSVGPAIGGLIITSLGYSKLFWLDGITCIIAGLLIFLLLHPKKTTIQTEDIVENPISVYKDKVFLLFLIAMVLFGVAFVQYFSTMPLFWKEKIQLSEFSIGLLMAFNGFLIFILEMPLVKWLESKYKTTAIILLGGLLVAISFITVNSTSWAGIVIIAMFLLTVGEMVSFPFSNSFALSRAKRGNSGQYMGLYTVSFSIAHIVGHKLGMSLITKYGYFYTWNFFFFVMMLSGVAMFFTIKQLKKEKS